MTKPGLRGWATIEPVPVPPDDAYGRVSNPERYRVLHRAADALVAELETTFAVIRTDGDEVDPKLADGYPDCIRVVRLTPHRHSEAPVTLAWTRFPGVHVRLGGWHIEAFPHCGCDACDEDPSELISELRFTVRTVVDGGFTETFDGRRISYELVSRDRRRRGASIVDSPSQLNAGKPTRYAWQKWSRREM